MKRICVFCGSQVGARAEYAQAAKNLAAALVTSKLEMVYGGGNTGLMGILADAVLAAKGHVIGVIPQALVEKEASHNGLPDLRVVESMHARKALMAELADGFIALPGGFGTLEELCEVLAWAQLGMHRKPVGLLNVHGYYNHLLAIFDHAVDEKFLKPKYRTLVIDSSDPHLLLDRMVNKHVSSDKQ